MACIPTYGIYTYGMYTYGMYTYGVYTYGKLWWLFVMNFCDKFLLTYNL